MIFKEALEYLKKGHRIRRKPWVGYWELHEGRVFMYCKDGSVLDLQDTTDILFTLDNVASADWEVVLDEPSAIRTEDIDFGEAMRAMKSGYRVARKGWNGKNMYVSYAEGIGVMVDGHEDPMLHPCFLIRNTNGSFATWVPSITDCLAEDWYVILT